MPVRGIAFCSAATLTLIVTDLSASAQDNTAIIIENTCANPGQCFVADTVDYHTLLIDNAITDDQWRLKPWTFYDETSSEWVYDDTVRGKNRGDLTFPVRAKLASGEIINADFEFAIGMSGCGDPLQIPFRGYSADGNAVIETPMGDAEILSPKLELMVSDARMMIDAKAETLIGTLAAPHDNGGLFAFDFRSRDEIYYIDEARCMSAAGAGRSLMKAAGCAPLADGDAWRRDRGLVAARAEDLDILKRAIPEIYSQLAGEDEEWADDILKKNVRRMKSDEDVIILDPVIACH